MTDAGTKLLQQILANFRVEATITGVQRRPAFTSYFVQLGDRSQPSRVVALRSDIAREMGALSAFVADLSNQRVRLDV